jgi:hypothetical protein
MIGSFELIRLFIYVYIYMLQMLGAPLCNIVSTAIRRPGFVHPYIRSIVKNTDKIVGEEGRLTNVATTLGSESHTGYLLSIKPRNTKSF